jgi:glycosyltransferase involved in cell wall biosynthesis
MKILIVIKWTKFGGAEKQAITDANLLAANGHDVTFLYAIEGGLSFQLSPGVKIRKVSAYPLIASLSVFFILLQDRFDIVHCHMRWAEKAAIFPAYLSNCKIINNIHGQVEKQRWYNYKLTRLFSIFVTIVACNCELACQLKEDNHEVPKRKLVTLYNSYDENQITRIADLNWQNKIIGFIGRFDEVKRIDHFIEIAKQLILSSCTDFKILIVGSGKLYDDFLKKIKADKLEEFFEMPGFVKDSDPYFKKMSLFILPSLSEGHSVSLTEAQAYGLPSIVYDVGALKEVIINGETGFLVPDPNDIATVKDRIIQLFTSYELWKKLSLNASANALARFSGRTRYLNLSKLYGEMLLKE